MIRVFPSYLRIVLALLIVLLLVSSADMAFAQIATDGGRLDEVVTEFETQTAAWSGAILSYATFLFWTLVLIEGFVMGIKLVSEGANMQQFTSEIIKRIFIIGFYFWLIQNAGFAQNIVDSFRLIATGATGSPDLSPSRILSLGVQTNGLILDELAWRKGTENIGLILVAIICMISFALVAAMLTLALVEVYVLINTGVVLLGFGGLRFTEEFARKYMTYVVSAGLKLFVMYIVIAVGISIMEGYVADFDNSRNPDVMIMLGVSIVFLALVRTIPDMVQSIISGVSFGGSGALISTGAALAGVAAAAGFKANAMAGNPIGKAASLATSQVGKAASAAGKKSGVTGAAGLAKDGAKAMGARAVHEAAKTPPGKAVTGAAKGYAKARDGALSAGQAAVNYISPAPNK